MGGSPTLSCARAGLLESTGFSRPIPAYGKHATMADPNRSNDARSAARWAVPLLAMALAALAVFWWPDGADRPEVPPDAPGTGAAEQGGDEAGPRADAPRLA